MNWDREKRNRNKIKWEKNNKYNKQCDKKKRNENKINVYIYIFLNDKKKYINNYSAIFLEKNFSQPLPV